MVRKTNEPVEYAVPLCRTLCRGHGCAWRLELLHLTRRPRLISNLLALVALFSIGFV